MTASHRIYYVNSTDTKLVSEGYEPKGEAAEELLIELLERLKTPAENITYRAPLNESVQFTEYIWKSRRNSSPYILVRVTVP